MYSLSSQIVYALLEVIPFLVIIVSSSPYGIGVLDSFPWRVFCLTVLILLSLGKPP